MQLQLSTLRLEYHELKQKYSKDVNNLQKMTVQMEKMDADLKELINNRWINTKR